MNSTQLRASSACMPPIMNFTPSTPIKEMEVETPMYDYFRQISGYEMRTVSTKSIHRESTRKKSGSTGYVTASDTKNAADDTKSVK
ncbi:hypothetical protein [uncultured Muribaculum sp.]|uniref:hypothetical protein n=1 Tax=uncultured Muribaculum sp. TaxID=1918613 RepID=UPI0025933FB6|nr:hypothetical protein [uncultured Muribaculum sp.]